MTPSLHPPLTRRAFTALAGQTCLGALGAAGQASAAAVAPADDAFPKLGRGINLHHLLNWPDANPGAHGTEYTWPPFQAANYQMSDAEVARLKSLGFDFVRITVEPGIFLTATPARLEYLLKLSRATVQRFLSAELKVIFDVHPVSLNPDYAPLKLVEDLHGRAFQRYAALMESMARSFHDLPHDRFALELMNEPWLATPDEIARWQPMLELLHARARAGSATLPLVLTGALWGDAKALMQLNLAPFQGSNVLYTFHYYDPHTYTHQGVEGDDGAALSGLQWPASHGNIAQVQDLALRRLTAAPPSGASLFGQQAALRKLLRDYELTAHDAARMRTDFATLATWARDHRLPLQRLFLGEFGCVASAHHLPLGPDRTHWFRTLRETAEASGFGWALWAYSGYGGMGLVEGGKLDAGVVEALGLR